MSDENDNIDDDNLLYLTEDATFALVSTLATEVIRYGEDEAKLIEHPKLKENEVITVMKANTLLTVFAMFLVRVVESKDIKSAEMIVNSWVSPAVQDMVQIAFADEIEHAASVVTRGIDDIEFAVNKETNEPPSKQGD
jgi:hypothetical protein